MYFRMYTSVEHIDFLCRITCEPVNHLNVDKESTHTHMRVDV